jgi:hypothetical protein
MTVYHWLSPLLGLKGSAADAGGAKCIRRTAPCPVAMAVVRPLLVSHRYSLPAVSRKRVPKCRKVEPGKASLVVSNPGGAEAAVRLRAEQAITFAVAKHDQGAPGRHGSADDIAAVHDASSRPPWLRVCHLCQSKDRALSQGVSAADKHRQIGRVLQPLQLLKRASMTSAEQCN